MHELAHNGRSGRAQVHGFSPSFDRSPGGLCALHQLSEQRNAARREVRHAGERTVAHRVLCVAAFALALAPTSRAQLATLSEVTDQLSRAGFGIYNFSVFGNYANTRTPTLNATGQLIPDYSYHTYAAGVSTSIGWRTRSTSKFHFNIQLSPSYLYEISSSGFNGHSFTPGNSLTAAWADTVAPRWTVAGSLSAALGNFSQLLLSPNAQQILTGTPGTSTEFGQTLVNGTSANTELNTAANSASSVVQGQESLLYGGFLLTASASMSANYAATPRTNISVSVNGSRTQNLPDPFGPRTAYLLDQTTTISGAARVSYQLSERTSSFVSVSYAHPVSSLYTTPTASVDGGMSRRLTEHWFASGSVGAGYLLPSRNGNNVQGFQRLGYQAALTTGYRILRNSFVGSVSRGVSDTYGLGATATLSSTLGWYWSPVGGHWGLSAGGSWVRLEGTALGNQGYSINVAIRESFSRRIYTSLGAAYAVASGFIGPEGVFYPRTQTESVQFNVGFRPYLGSPDVSRFGIP